MGLTIVPRLAKRINKSRFNVVARHSPVAYALAVLLAYCVVAGMLDVSLVFAAFLTGFAVVHKKRKLFADALDTIGKISFAFFIPIYFAIVGLKLDLVRGLSWRMADDRRVPGKQLCGQDCFSIARGAIRRLPRAGLDESGDYAERARRPGHCAGQRVFEAGIISPRFYTTLVLAAVLTSQNSGRLAGLRTAKGWPLLTPSSREEVTVVPQTGESPSVAWV